MIDLKNDWPNLTPGVCGEIIADIQTELEKDITDARRSQLERRKSVLELLVKNWSDSPKTSYSIIVIRDAASPPDISREDIINITAPRDLVEGLAKLALARYPGADRVIVVDEMGNQHAEWHAERS